MSTDEQFESFWLEVLSGNEELDVMPQGLDIEQANALRMAMQLRDSLKENWEDSESSELPEKKSFINGVLNKLE